MADATRELQIVISALDNASSQLNSVRDNLKNLGDQATDTGEKFSMLSDLGDLFNNARLGAASLLATFGLVAKASIDAGSTFEQLRVQMNSLAGDSDKAKTIMEQLGTWEQRTPFTIDTVLTGAKTLLAMGSSTDIVVT